MHYPETRRTRHIERARRRKPQPRVSLLTLYLLFLNVICLGMLASVYWPQPQSAANDVLPTAQVLVDNSSGPVVPIFNSGVSPDTQAVVPLPVVTPVPANSQAQPVGPLQAGPVPILMYHYIRDVDPAIDPMGYNLSVSPALFNQQMAWLRDNGYATVRMDVALRCVRGEPVCPPKAIVLTFDDGYLDAYTNAFPILQSYGFVGTFYVVNNLIGQGAYMTWDQVRAMRDAGMEIGAHTLDHLDLTTLDLGELRRQIEQSKLGIEMELGVPVTSFCYPAGRYNGDVAGQVIASGYTNATTTRWDNDYSDPFGLPRRRVEGGRGLDVFAAVVQG